MIPMSLICDYRTMNYIQAEKSQEHLLNGTIEDVFYDIIHELKDVPFLPQDREILFQELCTILSREQLRWGDIIALWDILRPISSLGKLSEKESLDILEFFRKDLSLPFIDFLILIMSYQTDFSNLELLWKCNDADSSLLWRLRRELIDKDQNGRKITLSVEDDFLIVVDNDDFINEEKALEWYFSTKVEARVKLDVLLLLSSVCLSFSEPQKEKIRVSISELSDWTPSADFLTQELLKL